MICGVTSSPPGTALVTVAVDVACCASIIAVCGLLLAPRTSFIETRCVPDTEDAATTTRTSAPDTEDTVVVDDVDEDVVSDDKEDMSLDGRLNIKLVDCDG